MFIGWIFSLNTGQSYGDMGLVFCDIALKYKFFKYMLIDG